MSKKRKLSESFSIGLDLASEENLLQIALEF